MSLSSLLHLLSSTVIPEQSRSCAMQWPRPHPSTHRWAVFVLTHLMSAFAVAAATLHWQHSCIYPLWPPQPSSDSLFSKIQRSPPSHPAQKHALYFYAMNRQQSRLWCIDISCVGGLKRVLFKGPRWPWAVLKSSPDFMSSASYNSK